MFLRHLVFCGGGTRCFAFVPALDTLATRGVLKNVTDYWGTSGGAFIAAACSVSPTISHMKSVIYTTEYNSFRNVDLTNIFNFGKEWGMDGGIAFMREYDKFLEKLRPGGSKLFLKDAPGLHIFVADLTSRETVCLDSKTFPNLRITEAVRASMSLPVFFKPYLHKESGHLWVDGAIRANFPWTQLPSDAVRKEALGFVFKKNWEGNPSNFAEYLFAMLHFDAERQQKEWINNTPKNILWFQVPPYPTWYTAMQKEDFEMLERLSATALETSDCDCCDLVNLPETTEIPPSSATHCTHQPAYPPRRRAETMDSHSLYHVPIQDSSPPQSSCTRRGYRRWSL